MILSKPPGNVSGPGKKRRRKFKDKRSESELISIFWSAPMEALFSQIVIAPVIGCTRKTLECDRWRKRGIPFRKVGGRVLYKKREVIQWLESHALVTSTSEYKQEEPRV